jgi:hypothetical protein
MTTHRRTRLLLAAGATAAITAAVATSALAPATAATGRAAAPAAATATTVSDYWEQTNHNISLSTTGGTETPIMTLALPAGHWVLHADQTIVNFGPSDYAGCTIADTATTNLNTHRTLVGNPAATGAQGPAALVTVLTETAAVSVTAPTTVTIFCEHDHSNGATPYIDANADLWAHRSANLVITQLP